MLMQARKYNGPIRQPPGGPRRRHALLSRLCDCAVGRVIVCFSLLRTVPALLQTRQGGCVR